MGSSSTHKLFLRPITLRLSFVSLDSTHFVRPMILANENIEKFLSQENENLSHHDKIHSSDLTKKWI